MVFQPVVWGRVTWFSFIGRGEEQRLAGWQADLSSDWTPMLVGNQNTNQEPQAEEGAPLPYS